MIGLPTEREALTVALWLEYGGLQWLLGNSPGHPVTEALCANFLGRVDALATARDLSGSEILAVIDHEARVALDLPADPLPKRRRRGRRGGSRNRRRQRGL